ncbi:MAG: alpha/beta hydrolase [Bdellovibrionaceae bacterium]|nr:alpha/beta hydrolase [Pseudobdellovibrionaceae bacterium]
MALRLIHFLFVLLSVKTAYASQIDSFRQCRDCSAAELDMFFDTSSAPDTSFKLIHAQGSLGPVILFHGLTDSPYYMKDIAEVYFRMGYDVYSPLMEAHGAAYGELSTIQNTQWNQQVEKYISLLHGRYKRKVILGGFSNGGLVSTIATIAAPTKDKILSLLLISPALGLPPKAWIAYKFLKAFDRLAKKFDIQSLYELRRKIWSMPVKTSEYEDPRGRVRSPIMQLNGPFQVARNIEMLNSMSRDKSIEIPVTVVLTSDDTTISIPKVLAKFRSLLGTRKHLVWLQSPSAKMPSVLHRLPPEELTIVNVDRTLSHSITLHKSGLTINEDNPEFSRVAAVLEHSSVRKKNECTSFYSSIAMSK